MGVLTEEGGYWTGRSRVRVLGEVETDKTLAGRIR